MTVPQPTNLPGQDDARLDDAVLAAVFSQSPVGLHVLDTRLRLVRVNTAAGLIRDFPIQQMIGQGLPRILHAFGVPAAEAGRVERIFRSVLATGDAVTDLRLRARSRTNPAVEAVVSVACFRLQAPDGTVLGVATSITDITERAHAQQRLQLLDRAATRIGTTLDIFRTADELCELAVPELADTVAVDVLDLLLRGEAPAPTAMVENALLRRAGFRSSADPDRQGVPRVGEVGVYPFETPYRQALADLAPKLLRRVTAASPWLDPRRKRDARLIAAGVHSMMVVPMRARGVVLGLACFYRWRNPTPFDGHDLALAEQLASRTALCLDNARLYNREHSVARILQRGLRQPGAGALAAVETAHAYLPAGAGGGWFDVVPLSGARVALAAGDTVGDRINATAAMGELRSAMAALSELDLPPDEILERLHELATRPERRPGDESAELPPATCVYLSYDPVTGLCSAACAGHPAPVVLLPDGRVELLDVPQGPPLGSGVAHYPTLERTLPEGSVLLLYNGALLGGQSEAPALPLAQVRRTAEGTAADLQRLCDALVTDLAPEQPRTDAYLLAARTRALGPDRVAVWTLENRPQSVAEARRLTDGQLRTWHLTGLADECALIVSELVTNAVRYASGPIELRLVRDRALVCEITDDSSTAPQLRHALTTDEGGRGLFITAQLTERWGVRPTARGKTIWAEQSLPGTGSAD